jgi:hypothetical protein
MQWLIVRLMVIDMAAIAEENDEDADRRWKKKHRRKEGTVYEEWKKEE